MAILTALRDLAGETIQAVGGRGFVRYTREGETLLMTDAVMRMPEEPLTQALTASGFVCRREGRLLLLKPGCALIEETARSMRPKSPLTMDLEDELHPVFALAHRLMRVPHERKMTHAGHELVTETLRLIWQPERQVLSGHNRLRAQCARMLCRGDRSGMYQCGCILAGYEQVRRNGREQTGRKTGRDEADET